MKLSDKNPNFLGSPEPEEQKDRVPDLLKQPLEITQELYRKAYLGYVYDSQDMTKRDSKDILNQQLIATNKPELVKHNLMSIVRVEIPNSSQMPMFYNTETKEYDSSVKSAIIATVDTLIYSEASLKIGTPKVAGFPGENNSIGQFHFERKLGRVFAPTVDLKYDHNYERVIDSIITGKRPVYYLPDTVGVVENLQATFGEVQKSLKVCVGRKQGDTLEGTRIVPNYNEFLPPNDIHDLIGANSRLLLSQHEGGLQSYLNYRQLELDLIKQGVSELKLSRLTKDDILEMLRNRDKKEKNAQINKDTKRSSKVK